MGARVRSPFGPTMVAALAVVLIATATWPAGGATPAATSPAGGAGEAQSTIHRIDVGNTFFDPDDLTGIEPGDTIEWTWIAGTHTVTAYEGASFNSGVRSAGATYTQTFPGGTVLYRCTLHSSIDDVGVCWGQCGRLAEAEPPPPPDPPDPPVIVEPEEGALLATQTVTVAGSAEQSVDIRIHQDGATVGSVFADADGIWSAEIFFPDGTHTITATAFRDGLESDPSPPRTFTVDTTPPDPPVIAEPEEGALLATATVTVAGSAEAESSVRILENGSEVGSTVVGGNGAWSEAITFPDGTHTITAIASDAAGNESAESAPRSFTVDTTPPDPPVIAEPEEDALVATAVVTIAGTAEAESNIRIFEDGLERATAAADPAGAWSVEVIIEDGTHTITAMATDAAGNESAPSSPRTFTVMASAPPPPAILEPEEGALLPSDEVRVTGTARTETTVRVFLEGAVAGTADVSEAGEWETTIVPGDGTHSMTATATDAAGNESEESPPRTFTVAAAPPDPPIILEPEEGALLASSTVTVAGTAEAETTIRVLLAGVEIATTTAGGTGGWSVEVGFDDGTHSITATATGTADTESEQSQPRTFTVDTTPPDPPVITEPEEGALLATQTVTVAGIAEEGSSLQLLIGGEVVGAAVASEDGRWESTIARADGEHTLRATATDAAGNESEESLPRTFLVDTTEPDVVILAPHPGLYVFGVPVYGSAGGDPIAVGPVTVRASVNATPSGLAEVGFAVDGEAVDPAEVAFDPDTAEFQFTFRGSRIGYHTVAARAVSGAGLAGDATIRIYAVPA